MQFICARKNKNMLNHLLVTVPWVFFSLFLSVSHQTPIDPVVSPSSGAVFEKCCIEEFIATNGCDPITKTSLSVDQLIKIVSPPVQLMNSAPNDGANASHLFSAAIVTCNTLLYQTIANQKHIETVRMRLRHMMHTNQCTFQMLKHLKLQMNWFEALNFEQ